VRSNLAADLSKLAVETRGVPLEQMSQLFEDDMDEKQAMPEREPLAGTRSRSRSPVRGDTESQVEPPDLSHRVDDSGGVLGALFGSEIQVRGFSALTAKSEPVMSCRSHEQRTALHSQDRQGMATRR
jgi:hypothetical protein